MAVSGLGTTWNLPNYAGELFTADTSQTPFLTMAGGLTGGMMTDNFEFPTAILFEMHHSLIFQNRQVLQHQQLHTLIESRKATLYRFIRKLLI